MSHKNPDCGNQACLKNPDGEENSKEPTGAATSIINVTPDKFRTGANDHSRHQGQYMGGNLKNVNFEQGPRLSDFGLPAIGAGR
jgi:hypothetical protein